MAERGTPTALTLERERLAREEGLRGEVGRQVNVLIQRGYPQMLGMTAEEYASEFQLPSGVDRKASYVEKFPHPLVVDPRVSLDQLAEYIGPEQYRYQPYVDRDSVSMIEAFDGQEHAGIEAPYLAWVNFGRFRADSLLRARKGFGEEEVGSSTLEAVALYMQYGRDRRFENRNFGIVVGGEKGACCDLGHKDGGAPITVNPSSDGNYSVTLYAWGSLDFPERRTAGIMTRGKDIIPLISPESQHTTVYTSATDFPQPRSAL